MKFCAQDTYIMSHIYILSLLSLYHSWHNTQPRIRPPHSLLTSCTLYTHTHTHMHLLSRVIRRVRRWNEVKCQRAKIHYGSQCLMAHWATQSHWSWYHGTHPLGKYPSAPSVRRAQTHKACWDALSFCRVSPVIWFKYTLAYFSVLPLPGLSNKRARTILL